MDRYKPFCRKTSYANEFFIVESDFIKLVFCKRLSGWGFIEVYDLKGNMRDKPLAIISYLGELLVRDQEIPMRIEADDYTVSEDETSIKVLFNVKTMNVQGLLDNTSFAPWMHYPFTRECLSGNVCIKLSKISADISYDMNVKANENMYVKYIRGPWLKIGEENFGALKDDAILPGVEWLQNNEWASGDDWFRKPWCDKYAPNINKVSIPCMALSYNNRAIGISWDPKKWATRWFNYAKYVAQPVFAIPNFVDRSNNSLMGLMVPSALSDIDENQVYSEFPIEMHYGQMVRLSCNIFITQGRSLDAITRYVKSKGMPEVDLTKTDMYETIKSIAASYNSNLWDKEKGFGVPQKNQYSFYVPGFLRRFINENSESQLSKELKEKIEICDSKVHYSVDKDSDEDKAARLVDHAKSIMSVQNEDGSFSFEPEGRHKSKDDFTVARVFCEPMGIDGDTALDMNATAINDMISTIEKLKKFTLIAGVEDRIEQLKKHIIKAIDACSNMTRPEGGDFWETPLHAPNLYATGHAAIAYYRSYLLFNEKYMLDKAIYYIRALLPFTHLWEPENIQMIYNTKPCLCSSDWYFANWVRDHVQWEVLAVFNQSFSLGINWADIDKDIDWKTYHKGITMAAARWRIDHTKEKWMPHNIPETYDSYIKGCFDGCFPDTHNCVTGNYGGMVIMPQTIADNLYSIIDFYY